MRQWKWSLDSTEDSPSWRSHKGFPYTEISKGPNRCWIRFMRCRIRILRQARRLKFEVPVMGGLRSPIQSLYKREISPHFCHQILLQGIPRHFPALQHHNSFRIHSHTQSKLILLLARLELISDLLRILSRRKSIAGKMKSMSLVVGILLVLSFQSFEAEADFDDDSLSGKPNGRVCEKSPLREADGTQQPDEGTCSKTQLGEIPSTEHMTSTLILQPQNGAKINEGESFEVIVKVIDLETGFFSDPDNEYYSFSQQLNNEGVIKGHTHIVIQKLRSKSSPPDATDFEFFKGLNLPDEGDGKLFQTVDGLSSGKYRLCTMASSFSHNSLIMPVAQRGPQDDCIRFTVK